MFLRNKLVLTTIIFVICIIILFTIKPNFLFKDGKTIPFGIGNYRTIFSMTTIVILLTTVLSLIINLSMADN